jgi:hypothetical protein
MAALNRPVKSIWDPFLENIIRSAYRRPTFNFYGCGLKCKK